MVDVFSRRLADLALALRFFSRLPVPRLGAADDPMRLPDFSRASAMMPLAGSLIALPAAALGALLALTSLPDLATGALVVVLLVTVTGALHEDGLGDTADGFFGGQSVEKRLAIMRDSRIGSFASAALALSLFLRASLYGALATFGPWVIFAAILATAAVSRSAVVVLWLILPPARPDGLSASVGQPLARSGAEALALAALLALPVAILAGPLPALTGAFLVALFGYGLARLATSKIGGQTGDVLGAMQQIGELAFLIGLAIYPLTS